MDSLTGVASGDARFRPSTGPTVNRSSMSAPGPKLPVTDRHDLVCYHDNRRKKWWSRMADRIDVSLSLNEEQFTRLKGELVDARPPFWRSEALLRTAQILAIVVGGCWVLI